MRYAVCIPVGPGEADTRRLRTLVASLFRHERAVSLLVIADASGDDAATQLRELVPPTCQGVRLDCAAAAAGPCGPLTARLMGLRYLSDREDVDVCVQLGLGCMVAGAFAGDLDTVFAAHPSVGLVGRLGGGRSDGKSWRWKQPKGLWLRNRGHDSKRIARFGRGGEAGAYCLGGAYAIARPTIAALETAGLLGREWPADVDEGRLVSAMTLSAGYTLADLSRPGQVFGVEPVGLPGSPRALGESGYAIVGDVTNDTHHSEREVVAFFENAATEASPA